MICCNYIYVVLFYIGIFDFFIYLLGIVWIIVNVEILKLVK